MAEPRDEVSALLKDHRCTLLRSHKHEVWELPGGQRFVRAKTPSDSRSDANSLRQLRQMLGVNGERGEAGKRRQRGGRRGRASFAAKLEPSTARDFAQGGPEVPGMLPGRASGGSGDSGYGVDAAAVWVVGSGNES